MTNKHRLLKINPGLVPALSQMARCSFRQTSLLPLDPPTPSSVGVWPGVGLGPQVYSTGHLCARGTTDSHGTEENRQGSERSCSRPPPSSQVTDGALKPRPETRAHNSPDDSTAALCSLRTLREGSVTEQTICEAKLVAASTPVHFPARLNRDTW